MPTCARRATMQRRMRKDHQTCAAARRLPPPPILATGSPTSYLHGPVPWIHRVSRQEGGFHTPEGWWRKARRHPPQAARGCSAYPRGRWNGKKVTCPRGSKRGAADRRGSTQSGAEAEARTALARISHRLNPRLRGGAASPEAGRAEDYSGYENRGEDRKMGSEMPMDGLYLLEDDGVDTRCLSALRSSSSGGRIGQVAELGWEAA